MRILVIRINKHEPACACVGLQPFQVAWLAYRDCKQQGGQPRREQMASSKAKVLPYLTAGPTKLTLTIRDGSKTLPMLQHGSKLYVVAVPGEEFRIRLERITWTGNRAEYLADADVDGESVGYVLHLGTRGFAGEFPYYMGAPGAAPGEATKFKFQPACADNSAAAVIVEDPDTIKAGRIRVDIHECGAPVPDCGQAHLPPIMQRSSQPPTSLPDGKKFFMAPSLTCGKGSSAGVINWGSECFRMGQKLDSVEVHYETAATLVLRKVLDPNVLEHKSIIEEYGIALKPDTSSAAAAATGVSRHRMTEARGGSVEVNKKRKRRAPDASLAPARSTTRKAPAAIKRSMQSREVKPDIGVGIGAGNQAAAVQNGLAPQRMQVLDLTIDPLVVDGQELRRDQMAVCDLTTAEDAMQQQPGMWQVIDKVKEEVIVE